AQLRITVLLDNKDGIVLGEELLHRRVEGESPYSHEVGCDVALAQHVECFADGEVTSPDGQDPDARTGAFDDRFGRVRGRGRVLLRKSVDNLLVFLGDLGVFAGTGVPGPAGEVGASLTHSREGAGSNELLVPVVVALEDQGVLQGGGVQHPAAIGGVVVVPG